MEGFDVHREDITIQESINRRGFPMDCATTVATPDVLLRVLKCAVCGKLPLPNFTWCQRGQDDFHLVCDSCVKKFTPIMINAACPVMMKGPAAGCVCLKKLTGFENGVSRHVDNLLHNLELPCGAAKYGCTFIGTTSGLQQHEMLHCTYRKLRVCYQPPLKDQTGASCNEKFNTYEELNCHLEKHGFIYQHNVESVRYVSFKDACDLTDKFVVIERRLLDYTQGRFCLLTVTENKTHIRMWLRDLNPEKDPLELPFYSVTTPAVKSSTSLCRFRTKVLPHSLKEVEYDHEHTFEVNKEFLRCTADSKQAGNVYFSVIFRFIENFSPESTQ